MSDHSFRERVQAIGWHFLRLMGLASIQRCNCMVRWNGGSQMPAIRLRGGRGAWTDEFTDPEGRPLAKPDTFEMMPYSEIAKLMKANNEVYIGHLPL